MEIIGCFSVDFDFGFYVSWKKDRKRRRKFIFVVHILNPLTTFARIFAHQSNRSAVINTNNKNNNNQIVIIENIVKNKRNYVYEHFESNWVRQIICYIKLLIERIGWGERGEKYYPYDIRGLFFFILYLCFFILFIFEFYSHFLVELWKCGVEHAVCRIQFEDEKNSMWLYVLICVWNGGKWMKTKLIDRIHRNAWISSKLAERKQHSVLHISAKYCWHICSVLLYLYTYTDIYKCIYV